METKAGVIGGTYVEYGYDGRVVPADDVGNIFSLWDFGGYELSKQTDTELRLEQKVIHSQYSVII